MPFELSEMLSVEELRIEGIAETYRMQAYAAERVISGELQIAASRLVRQRTQESAGESEMYDGINTI